MGHRRRRCKAPISRGLLVLSLILLGFGSGCGRIARIRECRTLTGLVNSSLSAIEAQARPRTPTAYRHAARGYVTLAKQVRTARLSGPTGRSALEEYAGLLESVAPAAETYALALEARDQRQTDAAATALDRFRRHERTLVTRIDAYCHAP